MDGLLGSNIPPGLLHQKGLICEYIGNSAHKIMAFCLKFRDLGTSLSADLYHKVANWIVGRLPPFVLAVSVSNPVSYPTADSHSPQATGVGLVTHRNKRNMTTRNNQNLPRSINHPDSDPATFFKATDVDSSARYPADFRFLNKQEHYLRLKWLNAGFAIGLNRYHDQLVTYEMAVDLIDNLSSQLGLTTKERSQSRHHFVTLDREGLGLSSDLVAYCVCAYVVEENQRNEERSCHPNITDEKKDTLFQQISESLNLTQREIVKTYGKVQNRIGDTVSPVPEDRHDPDHHWGEGI